MNKFSTFCLAFIFFLVACSATAFAQIPFRMNIGLHGPFNFSGIIFQADDGGFDPNAATNTENTFVDIGNTTYDDLYKTYKFVNPWTIPNNDSARWVRGGFPASTTFTLHLHFAELFHNNPKSRVFDVDVMGASFVDDLDVFDVIGGNNYMVVSGPVTTNSLGQVIITLRNGLSDNAMLAGIEIVNVGTPEFHNVLPIELVSFEAEVISEGVKFEWTTSAEIQNEYFTVERSIDGGFFQEIARVDGAGNSNILRKYEATDLNPVSGVVYYRLRQTDFDGTSTHSYTLSVTLEGLPKLELLNNPVTDDRIRFRIPNNDRSFTYHLRDPRGRMIKNGTFLGEQPIYEIGLPGLPAGIYHLSVAGAFGNKRSKVLVK